MIFDRLVQFRQTLYAMVGHGKDAVFDLMDAVLTSPDVTSFVSLSQSPLFRRQWPSLYSALKTARLPRPKLMKPLVQEVACDPVPLLAGDATLWPRPEAVTLKERTFEGKRNGSIRVGQPYSTLAWVPEADGSWALPLRHERITSFETPVSKAAFQLKHVFVTCRCVRYQPMTGAMGTVALSRPQPGWRPIYCCAYRAIGVSGASRHRTRVEVRPENTA